jgi:hypothetical protein
VTGRIYGLSGADLNREGRLSADWLERYGAPVVRGLMPTTWPAGTIAVNAKGMRVAWFTLEALTATIGRAKVDASVQRVVANICRADFIVIDDMGMPRSGQDAAEAFYRVIDAAFAS